MYKLLLISKYLRRKLAPLFAAVAVMLCTMMVIIVMSVMGGFLNLLRDAAHRLTGDVIVAAGQFESFPHYEELARQLEALPAIERVTPVIQTFGMLKFASKPTPTLVEVMGVRPKEYDQVVQYRSTLYWDNQDLLEMYARSRLRETDDLAAMAEQLDRASLTDAGMTMTPPPWMATAQGMEDGIVLGIEVSPWAARDLAGRYPISMSPLGEKVRLTVLPFEQSANLDQMTLNRAEPTLAVVNESKSGLFDIDDMRVYVRFDRLQEWVDLNEAQLAADDPNDPFAVVGTVPARTTKLMARAAAGYTADQAAAAAKVVVDAFVDEHPMDMPLLFTETWEQVHERLLGAVQNEKSMVSFLFIVISAVAVVMVATTFYMIVLEKTRDIGVLRAMGASRVGILGLFLGYGLAVGAVGAALGFGLGVGTVHYLNTLQWFLSTYLGVTAVIAGATVIGALIGAIAGVVVGFVHQQMGWWVARLTPLCTALLLVPAVGLVLLSEPWRVWLNATIRFVMWDPQTYYFDRIPNQVNYTEAGLVVAGAVLSSVIGAVVPALIAASRDPVEALRYE